jgi:tetratricopeptide (TPR) repeat protein
MASIIPGYEYDIFISYRQKDNKYDGWVTEFVDHLKRELDATFKEDVSIYFDENPHDGLLEIHNVDKSLENKLRSLIFIPVISQTYCDTTTFAWQNEFVAFNRLAVSDQLGRDIRLSSGNVCSRIIPIKIHDLDPSDTEVIEKEMGCRLRSIEFIFKSAGVNRPLKPSDNPDKNLNKTFYRDQINKVANAIKEIIYSVHPDEKKRITKPYQTRETRDYHEENFRPDFTKPTPVKKVYLISVLLSIVAVIIIGGLIIFTPKILNRSKPELSEKNMVRKAIAVLPVINLTGNPDLDYIASGIHVSLISEMSQLNSLTVRPRQSTLQFRNSDQPLRDIAKKLSVNNIIETSIKGTEDNLQLEIGLIEAFPSERYIWKSTFNQNWNNIESLYKDITRRIMDELKVKLTADDEKKIGIIRKLNPEITRACFRGNEYMSKHTQEDFEKGVKCFNEAIAIDPADPRPYMGLALGYSIGGHSGASDEDAPNKAKRYALKALELDSTLADAWVVLATRYLYTEWDFPAAEKALKHALDLNPNKPSVHYTYGWYLTLSNKVDEAVAEMKRATEIDPTDMTSQNYLAWINLYFQRYDDAITEARKTFLLDPKDPLAFYLIGSAYAEMGMIYESIEMHQKGLAISPGYESGLAIAYVRGGQKEKALEVAAGMEKYSDQWFYAWGLAEVYSALGEKEKAIDYLEKVYKLHGDFFPWLKSDLYFKPLLNEPRFRELAGKLNLPSK